MNDFQKILEESIAIRQALIDDSAFQKQLEACTNAVERCFRQGGKVLLCGNGGSAADAQHIAAELSGRFLIDRKPLFAEALHVNSSFVTAVANDYGFDQVYARMAEAAGKKGDILIAISTSGNSENILNAVDAANAAGMVTIGFTGQSGGKMAAKCAHCLKVPSKDTARIQEVHITIGHAICQGVESRLF